MRFRWFGLALASTSFLMSLLLRVFWGELTPFLLKRGVSGSIIGLVGSVFFIGYVIAQLIGGVLADRLGTGFIMGIGLIISGFLNTLYGVLPLSTWVPSLRRWRLFPPSPSRRSPWSRSPQWLSNGRPRFPALRVSGLQGN
jgi:sugar phosphate permease